MKKEYIEYEKLRNKWFKDPKFQTAHDELELEFQIIDLIIRRRIEQNLTQKDLAEKLGFKQPVISKLESGNYNPSIKFLRKVVKALDAKLHITIV